MEDKAPADDVKFEKSLLIMSPLGIFLDGIWLDWLQKQEILN